MKCWLLEINDHPSFNIYICKTETKGKFGKKEECMHEDCELNRVDQYVKKKLMNDLIPMMIESRYQSLSKIVSSSYGSFKRIFPSLIPEHRLLYDQIKHMRGFFYHLGG